MSIDGRRSVVASASGGGGRGRGGDVTWVWDVAEAKRGDAMRCDAGSGPEWSIVGRKGGMGGAGEMGATKSSEWNGGI